MNAGVLPLPRPRRSLAASRSRRDALRFSEPGAPLVAVCGLHGGAGTTTLAALLAEHAAAASPAGRVLAVEGEPRAGELAGRLGAASEWSLARLAAARGSDDPAADAPVVQRADGLRVLASAGPDLAVAGAGELAAVLAEARAAHALCVVDAGTVRQPAAEAAMAGADVVVWVADPARLDAATFASPLVRPARGARWVLALNGATRGARVPRALRGELAAVITVRRGAAVDERGGREAAEQLARAVRG